MWKKIIQEIQLAGRLTQAEIGSKCGTTQTTINSLLSRENSEPRAGLGERLKALHKKVMRAKSRADVSVGHA